MDLEYLSVVFAQEVPKRIWLFQDSWRHSNRGDDNCKQAPHLFDAMFFFDLLRFAICNFWKISLNAGPIIIKNIKSRIHARLLANIAAIFSFSRSARLD